MSGNRTGSLPRVLERVAMGSERVEVSKHSCRLCVRETEAETDLQAILRTHRNGKKKK